MEYLINPLKRAFDFKGRASRQEFWLYFLWLIVAFITACFAIMLITLSACTILCDAGAQQGCGWIGVFISWASLPLGAIVLLPAVFARRLHDMDMRGWWMLLFLIPYLGFLLMCILMSIPGTKGENRFGPVPKE